MVHWIPCFLCSINFNENFVGEGDLEIGENYNPFSKIKYDTCPLCNGKRQLAVKPYVKKSWEKYRKDSL